MIRILFVFLMMPSLLWANDFPALFDVSGVASNDVLNVRAEGAASAPIVGMLAHDANDVEVVALSGNWGQINTGETSGWVSMRYLAAQEPNPDYALAQRLSCYGTEPFWSAEFVQGQKVTFSSPEGSYETPGAGLMIPASGVPGLWAMAYSDSVATFRREMCSDGMSDRMFGLSVALFKRHAGEVALFSGCCSITSY